MKSDLETEETPMGFQRSGSVEIFKGVLARFHEVYPESVLELELDPTQIRLEIH